MLDDAISDFLGIDSNKFPKENPKLIVSRYGSSMNERIQVIMTAFEHELHNNPNLEIAEAIEVAKAKISEKFPEIGQSGLDALERAFSYWFK